MRKGYLSPEEQDVVEEYVGRLKARFGSRIEAVKLYGSKARGDYSQESDIDLLIVADKREGLVREVVDLAVEVAGHSDILLSPKVVEKQDFFRLQTYWTSPYLDWEERKGELEVMEKGELRLRIVKLLDKSRKKIRAARLLLREGEYEDAISRAYYAMFLSAKALLLTQHLEPKTHRGLLAMLSEHFVKTRQLDARYRKMIAAAKELRENSDYFEDYEGFLEEAEETVKDAEEFGHKMRELIDQWQAQQGVEEAGHE